MKKDKNWLKEQIKHEEIDLKYAFDNYVPYEKVLIADDVNDLLNQLEESEQEKVKLYKVELPIDRLHHILTIHADGSGHFFGKEHTNNGWYRTHLTEQEIKTTDERFWTFRKEVED